MLTLVIACWGDIILACLPWRVCGSLMRAQPVVPSYSLGGFHPRSCSALLVGCQLDRLSLVSMVTSFGTVALAGRCQAEVSNIQGMGSPSAVVGCLVVTCHPTDSMVSFSPILCCLETLLA